MEHAYEIVLFRVKPDVSLTEFMTIYAQFANRLRTCPGYVSHELLHDDDGQWVDLVRWESLDDVSAAADSLNDTEVTARLMAVLEPESVRMIPARPAPAYG